MHRSRVGVLLIDYPAEDHAASLAFWAAATGREVVPETGADGEPGPFQSLGALSDLELAVQRTGTGTAPRLHLDVETDDVLAEVERLRALGATVHEHRSAHTIMRDPGSLLFCVVPVQSSDAFADGATSWH